MFDTEGGAGMAVTQEIFEKLEILTDAAKYDVACTSSGSSRKGRQGESAIVLRQMAGVFLF